MAFDEDRLSDLADNLLSYEILSKLPLRDAIRSSILSSRWRSLWTIIPQLHFSKEFFTCIARPFESSIAACKYTDIMHHILLQHAASVESFRFEPTFRCKMKNEKVEEWIHSIAVKGVKQIAIRSGLIPMLQAPASLFSCQSLTALELGYVSLSEIPKDCQGFPSLITCCLHFVLTDTEENIVEQFISLCPLLQNLMLSECYGLRNLKICAQNLNYLKLIYCSFQTLTVDCSQLIKLEILTCEFGPLERNICSESSPLKVNCPSSLNDVTVSDFWLLASLSAAKTLRKMSIGKCTVSSACSLLIMLCNFPNLENITVNEFKVETNKMVEGKDMGVALDLNFPHLKEVCVDIVSEMDDKMLAMLSFLLSNTSLLRSVTFTLPSNQPEVINQILNLKKASEEIEIRIFGKKRTTYAV